MRVLASGDECMQRMCAFEDDLCRIPGVCDISRIPGNISLMLLRAVEDVYICG